MDKKIYSYNIYALHTVVQDAIYSRFRLIVEKKIKKQNLRLFNFIQKKKQQKG